MTGRRVLLAAALVLASSGAACARDQDPGIVPSGSTQPGVTTPHQFPQDCPPGGPDATTPSAGCVDADGNIVH